MPPHSLPRGKQPSGRAFWHGGLPGENAISGAGAPVTVRRNVYDGVLCRPSAETSARPWFSTMGRAGALPKSAPLGPLLGSCEQDVETLGRSPRGAYCLDRDSRHVGQRDGGSRASSRARTGRHPGAGSQYAPCRTRSDPAAPEGRCVALFLYLRRLGARAVRRH
jgi:hypothetical protein